jgi:hypothetical protein
VPGLFERSPRTSRSPLESVAYAGFTAVVALTLPLGIE